jgi:hypothetical protein
MDALSRFSLPRRIRQFELHLRPDFEGGAFFRRGDRDVDYFIKSRRPCQSCHQAAARLERRGPLNNALREWITERSVLAGFCWCEFATEPSRERRAYSARRRGLLLVALSLLSACSANNASSLAPSGSAGGQTFASGGTTSVYTNTGGAPSNGGSPSVDTGGASALDGGHRHDSTLFAWPESNADGGTNDRCKPGHYVGTYSCNVLWGGDAGFRYALTGPVDLTLDKGQSGEFLTVSGGTLKSMAAGLTLDATVVGQLDCQTGQFSGNLTNGEVSIPPFPPGGTFSGPLAASFDSTNPTLDGTWTLIGGTTFAGASCHGPWNAVLQNP